MTPPKRYALVTGCSESGMGWYVAREFANRGVHTFATLRNPSKAGDLGSLANIEVLELDITSTASIQACVEKVKERTGGRLDYLYNNAGAQFVMPIADQDIEMARKLFDTNVWSILEMSQAFLPLLVEAQGYIANAGSIRSYLPQEFDAVYGMSKIAITLMTENMRFEFAPLGVKVAVVTIGGVGTLIFQNQATYKGVSLPENSYYKSINKQISRIATGSRARDVRSMKPAVFAKRVVGDILSRKTPHIWRGAYSSLTRLLSLLPIRFVELFTLKSDSGLPALAKDMETKRKSKGGKLA